MFKFLNLHLIDEFCSPSILINPAICEYHVRGSNLQCFFSAAAMIKCSYSSPVPMEIFALNYTSWHAKGSCSFQRLVASGLFDITTAGMALIFPDCTAFNMAVMLLPRPDMRIPRRYTFVFTYGS